MTVCDWQSLLYPILFVECLLASAANIGIFLLVNRAATIVTAAITWLILASSFAVLTLVTGNNPQLDIDQFRPMIVWTRGALAISLIAYVTAQTVRILKKI